ncbi:hypothetical protein ACWDR7_10910 [Microbacterium sp. NPDC003461]
MSNPPDQPADPAPPEGTDPAVPPGGPFVPPAGGGHAPPPPPQAPGAAPGWVAPGAPPPHGQHGAGQPPYGPPPGQQPYGPPPGQPPYGQPPYGSPVPYGHPVPPEAPRQLGGVSFGWGVTIGLIGAIVLQIVVMTLGFTVGSASGLQAPVYALLILGGILMVCFARTRSFGIGALISIAAAPIIFFGVCVVVLSGGL